MEDIVIFTYTKDKGSIFQKNLCDILFHSRDEGIFPVYGRALEFFSYILGSSNEYITITNKSL